jgi:lipopolysaccharide export system protein LptA
MYLRLALLFFFCTLASYQSYAQKKVQYAAEGYQQKVGRGQNSYITLVKKVRFDLKSDNTIITGDSSLYYDKQGIMIVFGNVLVKEGDSVTIRSNKLTYFTNERRAEFRQNVVFNDGNMTLYTNYLDYFTETRNAKYYNNGKVIDAENTLTSKEGDIDNINNTVTFRRDVVLISPEYELRSNFLIYDRSTKVAVTKGFTKTILKNGEVVDAKDGGTFVTDQKQVTYKKGKIDTDDYEIYGDDLFFDDINQISKAKGNVILVSKEDDLVIFGDEAASSKEKGYTKIWGNTLMIKPFEQDTLYLKADTLVSIDSNIDSLKRLLAYKNVKIFRDDLQGIADSLAYFVADSMFRFYFDPVMWTDKNQIKADTISIFIRDNSVEKMLMNHNALIVSQDTVLNFNQIKGRNMTTIFVENQIDYVMVSGNGEAIFFAIDEEDDFYLMGMNRVICSDMLIRFVDGDVDNVTFYRKPDGRFIPPHELNEPEKRLPGFVWRPNDRPTYESVVGNRIGNYKGHDEKLEEIKGVKKPDEQKLPPKG